MRLYSRSIILTALLAAALPAALHAWGEDGHRMVNQVALASLPEDFPAWIHTPAYAARIAFLASEPDRWRDSTDHTLGHAFKPDHEIDLEQLDLAGIDIASLTPFRYEFAVRFVAARAAHADRFPPLNPQTDADHVREFPGFLPWAIAEGYAKVQVGFSYYKVYEKYGTPEEAENARANVVYMMGVMGHFVGDGSQPLHATNKYNGWVGPNPNGYDARPGIHSWIDSGFIVKAGITEQELLSRVTPAAPIAVTPRADGRDPLFIAIMDYLIETNRRVEPLYQMEKAGPLRVNGPPTAEGRAFIDEQLLRGGQMLGALWLTAWRHAGPDTFLQSYLVKRAAAARPAAHP